MNLSCRNRLDWFRATIAWLLFSTLTIHPTVSGAAAKLADQRNIIFDRYTTEHGLSHAAITAITQDKYGFMWIGTQEGLNRFDGYTFENFYHRDDVEGSISNNSINALLTDSKGVVWVGTDHGLDYLDLSSKTFSNVDLKPDSRQTTVVLTIYESKDGTLWVGTDEGLLSLLPSGDVLNFTSESFGIGAVEIRNIFQDDLGILWVTTDQKGLLSFDKATTSFKQHNKNVHPIRNIMQDSDGILWVSNTNGGITLLNDDGSYQRDFYSLTGEDSRLPQNRVRDMLTDSQGNVWLGTAGGLHLHNPKEQSFVRFVHDDTDAHSLSDNNVTTLYQDFGGVIWLGTYHGVSKFNAVTIAFPKFRQASYPGLKSDATASFAEGKDGDVWIGTFGGLHKWDAQTSRFTHYTTSNLGLSDNRVMSLQADGETLWVGTMTGGINVIERDQLIAIMQHDPLDPNSLSSNAVSQIYLDDAGSIWATTYGGGVNRYIGSGRFERFPKKQGPFSTLKTLDIASDNSGKLWIATDGGGIVVLDPETGSTSTHRYNPDSTNSITSDNITAILPIEDVIWIGTRDTGINKFDQTTGTFTSYNRTSGLASNLVYGMLADEKGDIWISGGKGLSVLTPATGRVRVYDSTHGLQSDDFNSGAYLKLSDGTFIFGGSNGFNAFYPSQVRGNEHIPPIRLTQLSKFNKPIDLHPPIYLSNQIELNHNDSVFGLEFAAMDYTAPQKNRFRYRLEGFDRDWTEPTAVHQVTYTNLDAGKYQFSVQGSNNDGVWNEVGTSIGITVHPPLWATWWAYAIYLAIGLILLRQAFEANQARLRREAEKRYNERLQLYIESLEEATDTVLIADANKNLLYANNSIAEILGISPKQAEGRSIMSLLFSEPDDARDAREGIQNEGRWHGEIIGRRGTETVTTDVTITAVKDENENETAFVSIARDITQRKKVEAELEAHRENLQTLVDERTTALKHEIAENKAFQQELANSLEEKELLLKEVHHRVKNNMQVISSLLNIQAETVNDDIFSGLLGESQQRIKSMSLIHENLYQSENLLEIDFEDYINMLANSLHRFYRLPDIIVSLDIQVFNVALDIETAVPCGLIINELISNSFKHAFKGRTGKGCISVIFKQTDSEYVLTIADDGNGLPDGFSLDTQNSMGTEIVVILTHQLDGDISFTSDNGTCFTIRFPKKEVVTQIAAEA